MGLRFGIKVVSKVINFVNVVLMIDVEKKKKRENLMWW